jgi:hypothetical protein
VTVALAATWNPRGELARLHRLLPQFEGAYAGVVVCFPPVATRETMQEARQTVEQEGIRARLKWIWVESPVWSWGRHLALKTALEEIPAGHVQYADMDRLLRWMETRPEEWLSTIEKIRGCDCLMLGRSPAAYATHPQSLVQTEAISNRVISYLLGREMDVSAGSKGFSRAAAEFVIRNSSPGKALGTDGEWPVLAQRGGYPIDYIQVDGLDWESADRYQDQAAGPDRQRQESEAVDANPRSWAVRVGVANEIVQCGLDAAKKPLIR